MMPWGVASPDIFIVLGELAGDVPYIVPQGSRAAISPQVFLASLYPYYSIHREYLARPYSAAIGVLCSLKPHRGNS